MHSWLRLRCCLIAFALAAGLALPAANGAPGKGLLGVALVLNTRWQGALVGRVAPETAAARAVLRPYDLIVQADSQPIRSAADLTAYLGTHSAGDRIVLTVMRWNRGSLAHIQVTATLGPVPDQGNPVPSSSPNPTRAAQTSPT